MTESEIFKIYGSDYKEMTKQILAASDLAGRIPGFETRIAIKPNLVTPTPAKFGATTHPEVVAGIVEYLQEKGFHQLVITEGSWVGDRTGDAYEYCGYRSLCERYDVPFVDAQKEASYSKDCGGLELRLCRITQEIDFLINVPVLKGHGQTKMTCALKNMKGLIPNSEKRHFHAMGLHQPIAHLSVGLHPDFIVCDHICGDLDFEEGGNPVQTDCIMTATDPVLLDAYCCELMGIPVEEVPYIGLAAWLGSGCMDPSQAKITELNRPLHPEEIHAGRKLAKVSYAVNQVDSCSACYAALVPALLQLQEEGLLAGLKEEIAIGQGFRGQTGVIGIGQCCGDFAFHVKGCPPETEDIYRQLKEYLEAFE